MTNDSQIHKFEFMAFIEPVEFVQRDLRFEVAATSDLVNQLDAGYGQDVSKDIQNLFSKEDIHINQMKVVVRGRRWSISEGIIEPSTNNPRELDVILEDRTLRVYASNEGTKIYGLPRNEDEVLHEMQSKTADVIGQIETELKKLLPQHTPNVMIRFEKGSVIASGLVILVVGKVASAVFNSATKALQDELDSFVALAIQRAFDYFGMQLGDIQVESTESKVSAAVVSAQNGTADQSVARGFNFRSFGLLWAMVLLLAFLTLLLIVDRFFIIGLRLQP